MVVLDSGKKLQLGSQKLVHPTKYSYSIQIQLSLPPQNRIFLTRVALIYKSKKLVVISTTSVSTVSMTVIPTAEIGEEKGLSFAFLLSVGIKGVVSVGIVQRAVGVKGVIGVVQGSVGIKGVVGVVQSAVGIKGVVAVGHVGIIRVQVLGVSLSLSLSLVVTVTVGIRRSIVRSVGVRRVGSVGVGRGVVGIEVLSLRLSLGLSLRLSNGKNKE